MTLLFVKTEQSEVLDNKPHQLRNVVWYQCSGAPVHIKRVVKERLLEIFRRKVIGRKMVHFWPPRSPSEILE